MLNHFYASPAYLPKDASNSELSNKTGGKPVILVIAEKYGETPSPCSYIRLLIPFTSQALTSRFKIRFADMRTAISIKVDVIVLNRVPCTNSAELDHLLEHISENGIKLVYDIDDNLLNLSYNHPEAQLYVEQQQVVSRLLAAADMVWVSTQPLAEALQCKAKKVQVVPNFLNIALLCAEDNPRPTDIETEKVLKILYMGTATHGPDLEIVLPALQRLHEGGAKFELYLIGITAAAPQYKWIKVIQPPSEASSYPKFMCWLRSLDMFDLGIAPLEENEFNRCKSAIKYWDYTSSGIPTLASNVDAYNSIIFNGMNGFLAINTTDDWYENLRNAMNNRSQLASILANAKATLKSLYKQLSGAERRTQAVEELLNGAESKSEIFTKQSATLVPWTRESIAETYLSGNGIEIGALHNPLAIPKCATAKYVDRMPKEMLYEHYPELRALPLVDVDIVDDGELLRTVKDNSQDFVIANHFLEHSEDPIVTLKNLLRVTKIGGVVYLAVPNMTKTFDCNRVETSLEHLILDHKQGIETSRRTHYEEWVSLVEPHFGRIYDKAKFNGRVEELMAQKYSIHFHCWTVTGFKTFLKYLRYDYALPFSITLFANREDEYVTILTKN